MAFTNFTNSPANGATITANGVTYTYNSTKGRWSASGALGLTTEQVQDAVGAMFTGNTETGIAATYEDSDGTIDLVVSAASSAATLTTARTIGGVSFDGSADINLPGVNAIGTQNTAGSAATLTTPRTIGGVSFDGSADIVLPPGGTDWDTALKTTSFTAVAGKGYLLNTTSGIVTVTLPASPSAGNIVDISDAVGKAHTNKIIIARNGSNIYAAASDIQLTSKRGNISLIYTDATNGWVSIDTVEVVPSYTLTGSAANVNEGVALTVSLATSNISDGATVPYTITGVTSADLGGVSLTGNFTISSNAATATFTPALDTSTEGAETMVLTLDGVSVALSTTINDTSLNPPTFTFGGTTRMFKAGGIKYPSGSSNPTNRIEKIDFSSDTSAVSTWGTLASVSPGSTNASGGFSSATHGININSAYRNKFPFASSGNGPAVPGIPFNYDGKAQSWHNDSGGYVQGGAGYRTSHAWKMWKQPFATDTFAEVSALNLPGPGARLDSSTENISTTHGYHSGGDYEPPDPGSNSNVIEKFPFASEDGKTDQGDLATGMMFGAPGINSPTHGYSGGGRSAGGWNPFMRTNNQKFAFASSGNASDIGDLAVGRYEAGGASSTTVGYILGGRWYAPADPSFPGNTFIQHSNWNKMPFSSQSSSNAGSGLGEGAGSVSGGGHQI